MSLHRASPSALPDWMPSADAVDHLLSAARAAPSAENRHWLQVRWDGLFRLRLDLDPRWGGLDRQSAFLAEMAAGAMVENLRLAGTRLGLDMDESWDWRAGAGSALVTLRLRPQEPCEGFCAADAIVRRCTNRRFYRSQPLPGEQLDRLGRAVAAGPGIRVDWVTAPAARRQVAALASRAEGSRFISQHLHHEMFAGIRLEAGWRSTCAIGLPPGALEIEAPLRPAFAMLRHWGVCRTLRWAGLATGLGLRAGWLPVMKSGALAVISSAGDGREDAVLAGRAMQRLWLAATDEGLAVQPMPAAGLFTLPWWQGVRSDVREDLAHGWEALLPGRRPLMLLRLGHAPAPSVRTARPNE